MAHRRYEKLGQYFHCSVAGEEMAGDKLAKVRPLIDVCNRNFKGCLAPGQNVSIDEAMIPFDVRLYWKQYMPKKPVKWGMKLWYICDDRTGYCLGFNVYTGKSDDAAQNLDLGYRVVMRLMRPYHLRYHHLHAENLYKIYIILLLCILICCCCRDDATKHNRLGHLVRNTGPDRGNCEMREVRIKAK